MTIQRIIEELETKFYDRLEEDCVEFTNDDSTIKEEYIVSNQEMAKFLNYASFADFTTQFLKDEGVEVPEWIANWTGDMLDSDLFDTGTEHGYIKFNNKKGSEIL